MIFITFNNRNDNFGDQLIFSLLYRELSKFETVYILNNAPAILKNRLILRIREALKLGFMARMRGERFVLLDPPCARLAPRFTKKSVTEVIKIKAIDTLWHILGAEKCVVGISVAEDLPNNTFHGYKLVGLRDKVSLEQISKLNSNASYCPDMACLMDVKQKAYRKNGRILMSFRKDVPEIGEAESSDKVMTSLDVLINNKSNHLDKMLVSFYAQVNEDIDYNRDLVKSLLNHNDLIISDAIDESYYSKLFENCQLVISNRLHVVLPAMLEGVPVIALVSKSHGKIINLLTSYGLEESILYIEDVISSNYITLSDWDFQAISSRNYEKLSVIHRYLKQYLRASFNG